MFCLPTVQRACTCNYPKLPQSSCTMNDYGMVVIIHFPTFPPSRAVKHTPDHASVKCQFWKQLAVIHVVSLSKPDPVNRRPACCYSPTLCAWLMKHASRGVPVFMVVSVTENLLPNLRIMCFGDPGCSLCLWSVNWLHSSAECRVVYSHMSAR